MNKLNYKKQYLRQQWYYLTLERLNWKCVKGVNKSNLARRQDQFQCFIKSFNCTI